MENLFNELGKYFTPQQQTGEQNSQYNNTMKKLITKNGNRKSSTHEKTNTRGA